MLIFTSEQQDRQICFVPFLSQQDLNRVITQTYW